MTWDELRSACEECRSCALADTRTNVVFGVGNPETDILFVGEGPGQDEDLQGIPFVGRAGRLLDDMLKIIGLDRTNVYIANLVKCRPPGNRDPLDLEVSACLPYLRKQTALIDPKIIVCLGRIAASHLIHQDFKITREHGQVFPRGKIQIMAMYHPAFLLRDPRRRPEAYDDLKILEGLMKQRPANDPPSNDNQ